MKSAIVRLGLLLAASGCAEPPEAPSDLTPPGLEPPVTQLSFGRSGEDKDPDVAPGGREIVYASSAYGEGFDLFVRAIGAATATRLTRLDGDERFPKINPADPRQIAFCSNHRDGAWEIYLMADMARPEKLAVVSEPGEHAIHPSWSPDGRRLVYCSTSDLGSGDWRLKIVDLGTGKTRILEGIDGFLPEWSPRGDRIVVQRMRRRDGWLSGLWVLEGPDGDAPRLSALLVSDDWAAINPAWSPDGRRIVFATVAKSLPRAGVLTEGDDLWVVDVDGSHPTRLTASPAADYMPCWAGDGRIYFVSKRSGGDRLWSLDPGPLGAAASR
jgi:TolB protein